MICHEEENEWKRGYMQGVFKSKVINKMSILGFMLGLFGLWLLGFNYDTSSLITMSVFVIFLMVKDHQHRGIIISEQFITFRRLFGKDYDIKIGDLKEITISGKGSVGLLVKKRANLTIESHSTQFSYNIEFINYEALDEALSSLADVHNFIYKRSEHV